MELGLELELIGMMSKVEGCDELELELELGVVVGLELVVGN